MPQSKERHTEYMREKRGSQKGSQDEGSQPEGSRGNMGLGLDMATKYPAVLLVLVDPIKRIKLEKIYLSLKDFKQAENVYYGCGKGSVPFDVVGDWLEATSK